MQHAADVAKPDDTIYVMAGRYNERIKVRTNGGDGQPIKFQAMPLCAATVSGFDLDEGGEGHDQRADAIEGWQQADDSTWSAPLAGEPKKVLRDGQPWTEFTYDKAVRRIMVKTGGDPPARFRDSRAEGGDRSGRQEGRTDRRNHRGEHASGTSLAAGALTS